MEDLVGWVVGGVGSGGCVLSILTVNLVAKDVISYDSFLSAGPSASISSASIFRAASNTRSTLGNYCCRVHTCNDKKTGQNSSCNVPSVRVVSSVYNRSIVGGNDK